MTNQPTLPILVASRIQNDAEHLNSLLRSLGMRVHCDWGGDADTLDKSLAKPPEVIFFIADNAPVRLDDLVRLRDLRAQAAPIIALAHKLDKLDISKVISHGARDLIGMNQGSHIKAVVERELPTARMAAQVQRYENALADYESRLNDLLSQSANAIAYIQEGIYMRANPAYLALFGYESADDIEDIPVMDLFDAASQKALKAAIKKVTKSGDKTDDIELQAKDAKGQAFSMTLSLAPDVLDDEQCIRLTTQGGGGSGETQTQLSPELEQQLGKSEREAAALKASLADIRHRDPLTGVYHRAYFLEHLRTVKTSKNASRALALIAADQFSAIEASVGAYGSDRIISSLVELIGTSVSEHEPIGRYDDDTFAVVLSRPALADIEKWATTLCKAISKKVFETDDGSTTLTCSIGLTEIESLAGAETLLTQALEALDSAAGAGGNKHVVYQPPAVDSAEGESDASWIKRITSALKNDTFQLAYQPIASLEGDGTGLQDVVVQMKDGENGVIAASQFIPIAKRRKLTPAIDKWVIEHLIPVIAKYHKENPDARFFARISSQFLTDPQMIAWLQERLNKAASELAGSLIIQISEQFIDKNMVETKQLIAVLHKAHCGFAISDFGLGRNSPGVLDHLKPDFIKLNDDLVNTMGEDEDKHTKVSSLVATAQSKKTEVIAHRIESANAIAMLFGMGVEYIQGNYLQEAGAVIQDPSSINIAQKKSAG